VPHPNAALLPGKVTNINEMRSKMGPGQAFLFKHVLSRFL